VTGDASRVTDLLTGELMLERWLELLRKHQREYGFNRCLRALGVSNRRQQKKPQEEELKARVLQVVEEHPAYGCRRIKVELGACHGIKVNHKRLRGLLREWDLAFPWKVASPRGCGGFLRGQGQAQPVFWLGAGEGGPLPGRAESQGAGGTSRSGLCVHQLPLAVEASDRG